MSSQSPVCSLALFPHCLAQLPSPVTKETRHSWRRHVPLLCAKLLIIFDAQYLGACGKTSLLSSFALGELPKEYVRFSIL